MPEMKWCSQGQQTVTVKMCTSEESCARKEVWLCPYLCPGGKHLVLGHWWQSAGSEGPHPGVMLVGCCFSFCCYLS